ncbi:MAG: hypothetical protein V1835_06145 [Candidatus Micrarchaeota archaeon]
MRLVKASAPTKAIIAGEHSVVYGGMAIAAPLDNRKGCECKMERVENGKGVIIIEDVMGRGKYFANGNFEDEDGWFRAKAKLIGYILKSEGASIDNLKITMKFSKNKIPKGTGHSASTAAALAICLYGALEIKAGKEKLFGAVQAFEEIAHGGRPSGIDAQTVLSDSALKFRKIFRQDAEAKYEYGGVDLELPEGTVLLIINTLKKGEMADTTGALLKKFAEKAGIGKKPAEMSQAERDKITAGFDGVVDGIEAELNKHGNAGKLGKLFNKNHGMLREYGMSSEGIEEAIGISLKNGALGAKITGAGGEGGAVLVLCRDKAARKILKAVGNAGLDGVEAKFSKKGAKLD